MFKTRPGAVKRPWTLNKNVLPPLINCPWRLRKRLIRDQPQFTTTELVTLGLGNPSVSVPRNGERIRPGSFDKYSDAKYGLSHPPHFPQNPFT